MCNCYCRRRCCNRRNSNDNASTRDYLNNMNVYNALFLPLDVAEAESLSEALSSGCDCSCERNRNRSCNNDNNVPFARDVADISYNSECYADYCNADY